MSNDLVIKKGTPEEMPILKGSMINTGPKRSKFKLTIRKVDLPQKIDFNEKVAWICSSLGFFENIDKNKNAAAIFKEILLASSLGQVLTSTTIAQRVGMSRGSVINHLNNLLNAGLIEKGGKYYFARSNSTLGTITEIEDDLIHIFSRMKRVAKELDEETNKVIRME